MKEKSLEMLIWEVENELAKATSKFKPFNNEHEGYMIILEEMDELWDEVKKKIPNKINMRQECIQIAAMALRFIIDCM